MWIMVESYQVKMDPSLIALGISPKGEEDFFWTETGIRTEDIKSFFKRTDGKIVISFYEYEDMIIKDSMENFFSNIKSLDYNLEDEEISTS